MYATSSWRRSVGDSDHPGEQRPRDRLCRLSKVFFVLCLLSRSHSFCSLSLWIELFRCSTSVDCVQCVFGFCVKPYMYSQNRVEGVLFFYFCRCSRVTSSVWTTCRYLRKIICDRFRLFLGERTSVYSSITVWLQVLLLLKGADSDFQSNYTFFGQIQRLFFLQSGYSTLPWLCKLKTITHTNWRGPQHTTRVCSL